MSTKLLPREKIKNKSERGYIRWVSANHSQTYELGDFSTIGRDFNCQICLEDSFISQRHARIKKSNDTFFIQDLRSSNGTFVNGTRVVEAELKDKDRINIGGREFVFSLESENKESQLTLTSKNEKWNQQLIKLPAMAETQFPVFITGPSGSGKEILAKLIHRYSKRNYGPFVSVNCSALTESLVESELFGHIKGSFTGAEQSRKGAFESARGGTLFLDEIGDLPLSLQPKLLRALENSEIKPVGSDSCIQTDVRIVAATHNTLQDRVAAGKFRQDLFFRLNVLKLSPPLLKDRMEDFDNLLYFFGKEYRISFSFNAMQSLKEYTWPGNIRELKNFVARSSALYSKETVQEEHLDGLIDKDYTGPSHIEQIIKEKMSLKEIEREVICRALVQSRGNQRKSAEQLGLPKSTLHDRIKNYKIDINKLLDA